MKKAFTLIELLISIVILSIMMLFLYQSLSMINSSNTIFKDESDKIIDIQKIRRVLYLDFLLAQTNSVKIQKNEKDKDFVYLQSSNSIHQRFNPYITYMVKEKKLYRLESIKNLKTYELPTDSKFDIDYLGEVKVFKVYKSSDKKQNSYLTNIEFKNNKEVLLRVKPLNN